MNPIHRMIRLWWVVWMAWAALGWAPQAEIPAPGKGQAAGAVAPARRWPVRGGGTARSGLSAAQPPRGPVVIAWEVPLDGIVEGDPLVWDQLVVVAVRENKGRRTLHLLDLGTGQSVAEAITYKSDVPLEPSLWDGRIAVRSGRQAVDVLARDDDEWEPLWSKTFEAEVGPPLLVGDELFVCSGDLFECYVLGEDPDEVRWSIDGRFRGVASLLGEELWLTEYDDGGECYLTRVSLAGERLPCRQSLGWHRDHRVLKPMTSQSVSVMPGGVVQVSYGAYLAEVAGKVRFALLRPDVSGDSTGLGLLPASSKLRASAAAWGEGWLGLVHDGADGLDLAWKARVDGGEYTRLAGASLHPELVEVAVAPSVAGGVALVGAHAFEIESGRLLWSLDRVAGSRAVPVGQRVLLADSEGQLLCVIDAAAVPSAHVPEAVAGTLTAGRLVLGDGQVLRGDYELVAGAHAVAPVRKRRNATGWPLDDILVVADAEGQVVWSADAERLSRGIRRLVQDALAAEWSELASDAVATQDLELSRDLVRAARRAGASQEMLEKPLRDLARLARKSRRSVNERRAGQVVERRQHLAQRPASELMAWVKGLPEGTSSDARLALLLDVLAQDPQHAEARTALLAMLPDDLAALAQQDPLSWSALVSTAAQWPLSATTSPDDSAAGQALAAAGKTWRKPLIAVSTPRVIVISEATAGGISATNLARALTHAELTCDALDGLLPEWHDVAAGPLVIRLYSTARDYLVLAEPGDQGTEAGLGYRTVHHDPKANVCHLALPNLLGTAALGVGDWPQIVANSNPDRALAHHLARQWLRRRGGPGRAAAHLPGLWLEVGVASLIDDMVFDGRLRRVRSATGITPRTDLLNAVPEGEQMPWPSLLNMPASALSAIERQLGPLAPLPSATLLGAPGPTGRRNLFYSQSMALVQVLLDNPDTRPSLIEALSNYLSGGDPELTTDGAFGDGAEVWGQRALEWAADAAGTPASR